MRTVSANVAMSMKNLTWVTKDPWKTRTTNLNPVTITDVYCVRFHGPVITHWNGCGPAGLLVLNKVLHELFSTQKDLS